MAIVINRYAQHETDQRIAIQIYGEVQGVGFRPFVYTLADTLKLQGWVRNDGAGLSIEVQGQQSDVEEFLYRLQSELPPLARIAHMSHSSLPLKEFTQSFQIIASERGCVRTGITPDAAVCNACLNEMFDPTDRRYRYAFTNCTHCGPRYTITSAIPYDRCNTSMATFQMCDACETEYLSPVDRRFHAQPNACPDCGPQLALYTIEGVLIHDNDPITATVHAIRRGEIVAIKSLGGFHLVCDARNENAVNALRERKQREEKPFAVMASNIESLQGLVDINNAQRNLLLSHQRPVVLMRKQRDCDSLLQGIAPGIAWLGVMLPYTPLHYLLFHEAASRPHGVQWLSQSQELLLVMTSANPGGEPLVVDNAQAFKRLVGIADYILLHDRDIRVRCDDSVMRVQNGKPIFMRRARGFTPRAIQLTNSGPSVLACGAWYKNTVCVTRDNMAYVSQHIGDLDNAATCEALQQTVTHLLDILQIHPQVIAHDLHPDFFSTQFAAQFAHQNNLPLIAVQHHHAHIAAVMAEHCIDTPVIGVALDGVGLGTDNHAWGGELLRVYGCEFERLGHLRELSLPGGDRAAREPWRMAASALHMMDLDNEVSRRFAFSAGNTVLQMLRQNFNCPPTSSAGRWFDAMAGLLEIKPNTRYEGQAAMLLESLAVQYGEVPPLQNCFTISDNGELNLLPLLHSLLDSIDAGYAASVFHSTFALAVSEWIEFACQKTGIDVVVLNGGCFQNSVLASDVTRQLQHKGLQVYQAQRVPSNDGGISLGQAWVAMQSLKS